VLRSKAVLTAAQSAPHGGTRHTSSWMRRLHVRPAPDSEPGLKQPATLISIGVGAGLLCIR
jgi:hypothetical protein